MNQLLKVGQTLQFERTGISGEVLGFIGGGGQGEVYRVRMGNSEMALKWYFADQATEAQYLSLSALLERDSPSPRFLWPMDLVRTQEQKGFGYVMPLRAERFKSILDLMKKKISPSPEFKTLCTVAADMVHAFHQLHTQGLCYRDISFGNLFFDPVNGDIQICDNDNVAPVSTLQSGVIGTPRFMAPEIVRIEAQPDIATDLYSLAVLLFYLFLLEHPLHGQQESETRMMDAAAMMKLYGTNPIFAFDPDNNGNRPVPGDHTNLLLLWPIYPRFFQARFIQSFGPGLHSPERRVSETEWRETLIQLQDSIFYCMHCGAENFYHAETQTAGMCMACQKNLKLPPRLQSSKGTLLLNPDTRLFAHHLGNSHFDFIQPVAEVNPHPSKPGLWGLKNLSGKTWHMTRPDGTEAEVPSGRSAPLVLGIRLNFGQVQAEVRI